MICLHLILTPSPSFLPFFSLSSSYLQAYYVYVTNEEWNPHRVILNLNALPGVDAYGNIIATSVGMNRNLQSNYHGEVAWIQQLGETKVLNYVHEPSTFMMLTVPKVLTQQLALTATADATCRSTGETEGLANQLVVSTAEQLAVAILKFEYDPNAVSEGIVSAVLKLHLREATNEEPQVVTVLGLPDDWHEESVSWSNLIFLKPAGSRITKTNENFINWWSNPMPSPVGHITIPPRKKVKYGTGMFLHLDVTDAVQKGITQFMLVRVFRYDASPGTGAGGLPADNVQGSYFFTSKDSPEEENHPKLLIDYKVDFYNSPPPPSPPPPSPPVPPPPPAPAPAPSDVVAAGPQTPSPPPKTSPDPAKTKPKPKPSVKTRNPDAEVMP